MIEQERTTYYSICPTLSSCFVFLPFFFVAAFCIVPWTVLDIKQKTFAFITPRLVGGSSRAPPKIERRRHEHSCPGSVTGRREKKRKRHGNELTFSHPPHGRTEVTPPPVPGEGYGSVNEAVRGEIDGKIGFASISLPFVK